MEVLSGVIGAAFVFLAIVSIALYLDTRGDRKALAAWRKATDKRLGAHDEQLAILGRAVALLVPPDVRPTMAAPMRERIIVAPPPPSVEDEGAALQDDKTATRARLEAEADERDAARAIVENDNGHDEGEEEEEAQTQFYTERPTLFGVPLERPISSATRTAEAFRREHPSSVTLLSEGVTRQTLTPTEPGIQSLDAQIRRRWGELVAEAQEHGKTVGHCYTASCMKPGQGIDICLCGCEGCALVVALFVQAEREVRGDHSEGDETPA